MKEMSTLCKHLIYYFSPLYSQQLCHPLTQAKKMYRQVNENQENAHHKEYWPNDKRPPEATAEIGSVYIGPIIHISIRPPTLQPLLKDWE